MLLRVVFAATVAATMMASSSNSKVVAKRTADVPSLQVTPPGSVEYSYPNYNPLLILKQWFVRHLFRLLSDFPPTANFISKKGTFMAAESGQNRPYSRSTFANYTSVDSLKDKTYYGRHLPEATKEYIESLPPVDTVVAELFARPVGKQVVCPKSTLLFPVFAQHLVDSFIATNAKPGTNGEPTFDWTRTHTPHDINLLPLYGVSTDQTTALRLKSEESGKRGKLKSQIIDGEEYSPFLYDSYGNMKEEFKVLGAPQGFEHLGQYLPANKFSEFKKKIFAFGGPRTNTTPQISALNTLFLREHNRIAGVLEQKNPEWDDDRVFQTARNINIVIYLKIVIEEYINHIQSKGLIFKVKPAPWMWNAPFYKTNWISAEFAVLYRWHALVPDSMEWNGKSVEMQDGLFNNAMLFEVGGLRNAFANISANRATAMTPFNTNKKYLLDREKAALKQSRAAKLLPYVDYCKYLNMKVPKTFKDINRDPQVQETLRKLYGTPDKVEFYVGLMAQEHLPKFIFSESLTKFVAKDAFNQALTNPLLSQYVFNEETFSPYGWELVRKKNSVADLVERNTNGGEPLNGLFIKMTRPSWRL
jgi:prostaglandin-endoperoxide synthase 2